MEPWIGPAPGTLPSMETPEREPESETDDTPNADTPPALPSDDDHSPAGDTDQHSDADA